MFKGLGGLGDMGKMMKAAQETQEKMARMQEDLALTEAVSYTHLTLPTKA